VEPHYGGYRRNVVLQQVKHAQKQRGGPNADPLNDIDPTENTLDPGLLFALCIRSRRIGGSVQQPHSGNYQSQQNYRHASAAYSIEPAQS
jgi:hypothetical protein